MAAWHFPARYPAKRTAHKHVSRIQAGKHVTGTATLAGAGSIQKQEYEMGLQHRDGFGPIQAMWMQKFTDSRHYENRAAARQRS